jgi:hypothetical protein
MIVKRYLAALAAIAALCAPAHAADPKRIVFAAGPKDHGAPGRHEYEKDLAALKTCLDNSNIKNIATQLYAGRFPPRASSPTPPSW